MNALQEWLDQQVAAIKSRLTEEAQARGLLNDQTDIRVRLRAKWIKATVQVRMPIPAELPPVSPQRRLTLMGQAAAYHKHIRPAAFTPDELREFLELVVQWPDQRGRGTRAYEALLKLLVEHGNNPTPVGDLAPPFGGTVRNLINANLKGARIKNQKEYWLTAAPTDEQPSYEKSWQLWEIEPR